MHEQPIYRTGIGQDSHRFLSKDLSKPCVIGGIVFEGEAGFSADSDGDVVLHAICNAITSVTHVPILGGIAQDLCARSGITDSQAYVQEALKTLQTQKIVHVAISIEGKRPRMQSKIEQMRKKIAKILQIEFSSVGITVTSGDGLTDCGCGDGLSCIAIVTIY